MRSNEADEARRGLAEWSQPIVFDCLYDLYAARLGDRRTALRALALAHCRVWRFLLLDDAGKLGDARRDLLGVMRLAGLRAAALAEIDQAVLSELTDVVMARFQRQPDQARAYTRVALAVAARLATLTAPA